MALHVHRSERTDVLRAGLAEVLVGAPADPFTPDLVTVPTPGIERFLSQGLARTLGASAGRGDGVCANVRFASPTWLADEVIARATGVTPDTDPWLAHRAVWPLLAVLDRHGHQEWCGSLARHLGLGAEQAGPGAAVLRRDRRFAVAARLAELFRSYASQRPELLLDWAAGRGPDGHDLDGAGQALAPDLDWQPELWRALRAEIDAPSPAERLATACAAVAADPGLVDLPDRLSVFGPSRLPADQLAVLTALAVGREVHLWLADASPDLWAALGSARAAARRRDDDCAAHAHHPLLRSLGRDSRELALRLAAVATQDTHCPAELGQDTLLGRLQADIRANTDPWRPRADAGRIPLDADDRSVQVHACHGPTRQAEVIREVVLGLLQDDPSLEPRDILIMCPDLATFAPLLSAAFSEPGEGDPRAGSAPGQLRVRIADRTPEQSNEVLAALAVLLTMVTGRMELSTVLDFAGRAPVRARFGLDAEDLARVADLATQAGVHWGLDDATRGEYEVGISTGTWAWGLDRLLLGVALNQQGLARVGGCLPVDDVLSGDAALVGALAELVTRLRGVRDAMLGSHPVAHWVALLGAAITDLMDARGADAWQVANALGVVGALTGAAGRYAGAVDLSLADLRWMLEGALAGRPTRSNFRSGGLTVCGLVPMRSVPHRVICLVGMDDAAFPRSTAPDGDDALARDALVGERDPRSEDRQQLLDALMAAREHLVVTYTGADDRTNEARPPCVPLGELLDTLDAMARTAAGEPARTQVLVGHPLQPFDARNFTPGALGVARAFSHDRPALAAARVAAAPRVPHPPFLVGDLPAPPVPELPLQALGAFLVSPLAAFLRARIGIGLHASDDPAPERIPIELDGLARWAIGDRVLALLTRGESATSIAQAERSRGALPPGALGSTMLTGIGSDAVALAGTVAALRTGPSRHLSVSLPLEQGARLVGTIPDVYGAQIARGTYSRSKAAQALRLWPELLAAAVSEPDPGWVAHLVTKDGGWTLHAPAPAQALLILRDLARLHRAGLGAPLPLLPNCGYEYATRRARGDSERAALRAARVAGWAARFGAERDLPEVVTLWGADAEFDLLVAQPARSDDGYPDEPSRFGALARRVWDPILRARGVAR